MHNDCEVFGHYDNEIHKNMKSIEVPLLFFLLTFLRTSLININAILILKHVPPCIPYTFYLGT